MATRQCGCALLGRALIELQGAGDLPVAPRPDRVGRVAEVPRLRRPAEDRVVEEARGREIAGHELAPERCARIALYFVAAVVAGLPDGDLGAVGVADDRHAPRREHVHRVHHDISAARQRRGARLAGIGARDVRRPDRAVGVAPARRDAGDLAAVVHAASGSRRRPRAARSPSTRRARNRIPLPRPRRCWRGRSSRSCRGRARRSWASHSLRAIRDELSVRLVAAAVTSGVTDARTACRRRGSRGPLFG